MTRKKVPAYILKIFRSDPRIVRVRVYEDGFVPTSYKWPAPGKAREWERISKGRYEESTLVYERKRAYGRGATIVGYSAAGGRLYSR